jgi:hypothetical protein
MKTKYILCLLPFIFLTYCKQQSNSTTSSLHLPETQVKFLNKLKNSEDSIRLVRNDSAEKLKIISLLDNYVVDSVRQFKNWQFRVETIKGITLSGTPSYTIDLSSPVPVDSSAPTDVPRKINFVFTIPKDARETEIIELEQIASKLAPGDIIEMNGVIFMTDPAMEIVTLADYFDPTKTKKLFLIPVKINLTSSK